MVQLSLPNFVSLLLPSEENPYPLSPAFPIPYCPIRYYLIEVIQEQMSLVLVFSTYLISRIVIIHLFKKFPLVLQTLYASVQGNARAKKWEWVARGVWVEGMGDFCDSLQNVNEENT